MGKDHEVFWGDDLAQLGDLIKQKLKVRSENMGGNICARE